MVDVVQEQVQRAHALDDAGFQGAPFLGGDDARDQVERQDAVDRRGVGIDGEGDAALQQVAFRIGGAVAQGVDRQIAEGDRSSSVSAGFGGWPGRSISQNQLPGS